MSHLNNRFPIIALSKLLTVVAASTLVTGIAVAGNGGWGGGDLTGTDEPRLKAFIENGLKDRVQAYLDDARSDRIQTSPALRGLIAAGLEQDLVNSEYKPGKACFRTEDGASAEVDAATLVGDESAEVCFATPRLAANVANLPLEEVKRRLVALAVHEHSHHFARLIGHGKAGEAAAKHIEDDVFLTYVEPVTIVGPAAPIARTVISSTGDKIYGSTKLPQSYAVEEETLLPIRLGNRSYYVRPGGALASSCLANLERPMSFSYVSYGYEPAHSTVDAKGMAARGHATAEQLSLSALKGYTESAVTSVDGQDWTLVPITFDIYTDAVVTPFGAYYWAKNTVQYVLLSKQCSAILPQVRDRLAELRDNLRATASSRVAGQDAGPAPAGLQAIAKSKQRDVSVDWFNNASTQAKVLVKTDAQLASSIGLDK